MKKTNVTKEQWLKSRNNVWKTQLSVDNSFFQNPLYKTLLPIIEDAKIQYAVSPTGMYLDKNGKQQSFVVTSESHELTNVKDIWGFVENILKNYDIIYDIYENPKQIIMLTEEPEFAPHKLIIRGVLK